MTNVKQNSDLKQSKFKKTKHVNKNSNKKLKLTPKK